jgi:hypothetical protein
MPAEQTPLDQQHCVACKPGSPHLLREEIDKLLGQVEGWSVEVADGHLRLAKVFKFKGFMPGVEDPRGGRRHPERLHPRRENRQTLAPRTATLGRRRPMGGHVTKS